MKWLLFVTLGLILMLTVSALAGCDSTNSIESYPAPPSKSLLPGEPAAAPDSNSIPKPLTTAPPPPIASPPPPKTDWKPGSAPPAGIGGWQKPRPLSNEEKARVIQIAISSSQASDWLKGRTDYKLGSVGWTAVIWSNGEAGTLWRLEYKIVDQGIPNYVSPYAYWYPGTAISAGEDIIYQMDIAVDLDGGKRTIAEGPMPSLNSPGRFKQLTPSPSASSSNPSPVLSEDDQAFVWAAVVRQLVTVDDTFGGKLEPPTLYIIRNTDDKAGNPGGPSTLSTTIPQSTQNKISDRLQDLSVDIIWVDVFKDAEFEEGENQPIKPIKNGGVIITLGNANLQDNGSVHLAASIYIGSMAAGGTTYILEKKNGVWEITGTTNARWMS